MWVWFVKYTYVCICKNVHLHLGSLLPNSLNISIIKYIHRNRYWYVYGWRLPSRGCIPPHHLWDLDLNSIDCPPRMAICNGEPWKGVHSLWFIFSFKDIKSRIKGIKSRNKINSPLERMRAGHETFLQDHPARVSWFGLTSKPYKSNRLKRTWKMNVLQRLFYLLFHIQGHGSGDHCIAFLVDRASSRPNRQRLQNVKNLSWWPSDGDAEGIDFAKVPWPGLGLGPWQSLVIYLSDFLNVHWGQKLT